MMPQRTLRRTREAGASRHAPSRAGARVACAATVVLLAVVSCHSAKPRAASIAPAPASGNEGVLLRRPVPHVRIETEATWIASFVHFVDSMAGTSGGKTIPTYRRIWVQENGPPSDAVSVALERFAAARTSQRAAATCGDPADGSLGAGDSSPSEGPPHDWRSRFLSLALEAPDLEGFLDSVRPCLIEAQASGLASSLALLRPGFDRFWARGVYLQRFETRFRGFLDEGALTRYLGDVAGFFDVDPAAASAPVISFVLLPASGSTHAQAIGRRLLVEVRPADAPADQVSVVAHEMSHFLFELVPAPRLAALEARARAAGEDGERTWQLLREALPTALGQGLAVAQLTPGGFDPEGSWYHMDAIDRFAKRIYPIVRREVESGGTIDGPFLDEAIRAYRQAPLLN